MILWNALWGSIPSTCSRCESAIMFSSTDSGIGFIERKNGVGIQHTHSVRKSAKKFWRLKICVPRRVLYTPDTSHKLYASIVSRGIHIKRRIMSLHRDQSIEYGCFSGGACTVRSARAKVRRRPARAEERASTVDIGRRSVSWQHSPYPEPA